MTGEENNGKKVTKGVYFRIEGTGGDPKLALEVDLNVEEFNVFAKNLGELLGGPSKVERLVSVLESMAETERLRTASRAEMELKYAAEKQEQEVQMKQAMMEMQQQAIKTNVAGHNFSQMMEQIKQLDEFKKTLKSGGY